MCPGQRHGSLVMPSDTVPQTACVRLDLKSLFRRTWELFAAAPLDHLVAAVIVLLGSVLTVGILFGPLVVAYVRLIERQRQGQPVTAKSLFDLGDRMFPAIVTAVIVCLSFLLGVVLFVLPALLVVLAWGYGFWFVALDNKPPLLALRASRQLCKSAFSSIVTVWIIVLLLMAAGVASMAGVIVTLPLTAIFATVARTEILGAQITIAARDAGIGEASF
jgi:hypothetical protein